MDATMMLPPPDRCVRGKLQLFLRLWTTRQKYEHLGPYGNTSAARARFHLKQLEGCWRRIVEFQRALGLEMQYFAPRDQFELAFVVTAFVSRELENRESTIVDSSGRWLEYQRALNRLGYDLNPFDFGEQCSRCCRLITDLTASAEAPDNIIPLEVKDLALLHGMGPTTLSMRRAQ